MRRVFKAGRPHKGDQHLDGLSALAIATQQLKDLMLLMDKAGLKQEHVVAWLVVTHPVTKEERILIAPSRIEERIALLMHPDTMPLGIVFAQFDPSEMKKYFWSKHFLTDLESRRVVEAARQAGEVEAAIKNWN